MTVVAVGLAALAVLLVCGWRIRHLERLVAERERRLDAFQTWVADISHDLRTPLTLLTGPVRDLLDGRHGDLPKDTVRAFERAQRNADCLEALIERLIRDAEGMGQIPDTGSVESVESVDSVEPVKSDGPVDVSDTVRNVVEQFRSHAERAGIVLGMASIGRDFHVRADRHALERILFNLLSNAMKFTPRNGHVVVEVRSSSTEEVVRVDVQDSGCGIRASEKDRLFERFFRSSVSCGAVDGRGMGLNIAYKLLMELGGGIRVDSTPGKGARFSITIPKEAAVPCETSTRASVQEISEGGRPNWAWNAWLKWDALL